MGKKIVVLMGSPRKNGNSAALAGAFTEEARKLGHSVERFDTAELNVGGCSACDACYKKSPEKACVFDDDFNKIAPKLLEADAIVFVTPVYWWSFPAQLKAVIDKFYSVFNEKKDRFCDKECALIACAGDSDPSVFHSLESSYKSIAEFLGWTSVGDILLPGVYEEGDVKGTDGLQQAQVLAQKF